MADRAPGRVASTATKFSYAAPHLSLVTAVVPVKALGRAKSRLALPKHQRRQLALAFAADTLTAVTGCVDVAAVLVVTADADVSALASGLGAQVVPDHTATFGRSRCRRRGRGGPRPPGRRRARGSGRPAVSAPVRCLEVLRQADPFPASPSSPTAGAAARRWSSLARVKPS